MFLCQCIYGRIEYIVQHVTVSLYGLLKLYRETTADDTNTEVSTTNVVAQVLQSNNFASDIVVSINSWIGTKEGVIWVCSWLENEELHILNILNTGTFSLWANCVHDLVVKTQALRKKITISPLHGNLFWYFFLSSQTPMYMLNEFFFKDLTWFSV